MNMAQEHCEVSSRQAVMAIERKRTRLLATAELYGVSVEEVQSKARDVMIAILVNGFFEFVYNKPILDCKRQELDHIRNSEAEFLRWRGKPVPRFSECLRILDIIEQNL